MVHWHMKNTGDTASSPGLKQKDSFVVLLSMIGSKPENIWGRSHEGQTMGLESFLLIKIMIVCGETGTR